jgi:hypothetical protein
MILAGKERKTMPKLTVNVKVKDEAGNPLNESMIRLHRPNKPNKIGAE